MSRVCGWIGFDASEDRRREVLTAMTADAERVFEDDGAFWLGSRCALGVVPGATAVDAYRGEDLWAAVEGPVRFDDSDLAREARRRGAAAAVAMGYRNYGRRVLERVCDAFAIVVIRPESDEAFLAIDRVGGRHPLTYKVVDGTLIFGSDGDALEGHPLGRSAIDPQGIFNYLYFQVVPGPGTVRRDVRRLLPGHHLVFSSGIAQIERYWQIVYLEQDRRRVEELEAELLCVLRDSVRRDAVEHAGCFLSGGTDSSTIVGLLGEVTGRPAKAYAIGFDAPGYDEMTYARVAAKHFGADLREYYVRPGDVVQAIPRLALAHADPFGNASAVPAYYCARMAREDGLRRLLGGDGGDELFGGNERYLTQYVFGLYDKVPATVRRGLVEPLAFGFPVGEAIPPVRKLRSYIRQAKLPMPQRMMSYNYLERMGVTRIFEPDFLEQVDTEEPLVLLTEAYRSAHAESMLARMLALDQRFTLADNDLPKVSRSCELAGIEATYPLLSDEMLDLSSRVPARLNLRWGKLRWFWKHALRDFLPKKVLRKTKHGFGLPFGIWMRDDPQLKEMVRESLRGLQRRSVVRRAYIEDLLRLHESEHAVYYGGMIWSLVMLEHWFEAHVDRTPPPPR